MKAVILAAGEGVRMRPLTFTRSKHMIPLVGKPLLEYLVQSLTGGGVGDILMVVGYKGDIIQQYFGDGSKWKVNLEYVTQRGFLGTANAIGLAEDYVKGEPFLAVYGDLLITPEVAKSVIQTFKREGATTLAVVPVERPEQYGVVRLEGKWVRAIVEKPKAEEALGNLANAGIYVLTEDVFDEIRKTSRSSRDEFEITDTFQRLLEKGSMIVGTKIRPDCWMDVGRPWDLFDANERVLKNVKLEVKGLVEEGSHIVGPVGLAEGSRIRSGAYVEGPVFIDAGSDIGPNCFIRPYTSIGRGVRIGNACEIKNSIILNETHIAHLSYVGDSIIGEKCNLGAGTVTGNLRLDDGTIKVMVKDELVDSGRKKLGVIIGDGVKTAINVNFMPGVKIGVNTWIGPGVTIYRDVPPNTFVVQKQELEHHRLSE